MSKVYKQVYTITLLSQTEQFSSEQLRCAIERQVNVSLEPEFPFDVYLQEAPSAHYLCDYCCNWSVLSETANPKSIDGVKYDHLCGRCEAEATEDHLNDCAFVYEKLD